MDKFTAKSFVIGKGPKRIELLGDKTKKPESAQHIIEFPGGAVEVTRTTDGNYWAHIIVYRGEPNSDADGRVSAVGEVIDARLGREYPHGVTGIGEHEGIEQIAVLIRATKAA